MASLSRSPALRVVGAALLLTAGVLCLPGRAAATCGDYLTLAGRSGHAAHEHSAADAGTTPVMPGTPARPCTGGPGCSERPEKPVAPTSPPVTPTSQSKHVGVLFAIEPEHASRGWHMPRSDGEPVHISRSIFHPPRAS